MCMMKGGQWENGGAAFCLVDRQRAEGQQLLLAAWLARSIGSWHSKLQCRAELACWAASSCMAFSRKTAAYESSWFARANSCLLSPACSPGCSACAQCHACASCTAALVCTEPFKPPAQPPEQAPLLPAWSVSSGCCPALAASLLMVGAAIAVLKSAVCLWRATAATLTAVQRSCSFRQAKLAG